MWRKCKYNLERLVILSSHTFSLRFSRYLSSSAPHSKHHFRISLSLENENKSPRKNGYNMIKYKYIYIFRYRKDLITYFIWSYTYPLQHEILLKYCMNILILRHITNIATILCKYYKLNILLEILQNITAIMQSHIFC